MALFMPEPRLTTPSTNLETAAEPKPAVPPPLRHRLTDRFSRVGVELEFANVSVDHAATVSARTVGGAVKDRDALSARVVTLRHGEFDIGLDTTLLDKLDESSPFAARAKRWLGDVAALVAPVEVATPPLARCDIALADQLVDALRQAGASGTNTSLFYAFGTHLNVECSDPTPEDVLAILRAYILLEDWLRAEIDVNPTRSAVGFEAQFPTAFQQLVLDADYAPGVDKLIDDYLASNATRNRGLDLLPILAQLDLDRIEAAAPSGAIKPRPAFHYRLPNCEIDEPSWSVAQELMRWERVEQLASRWDLLVEAMDERMELFAAGARPRALAAASVALGVRLNATCARGWIQ